MRKQISAEMAIDRRRGMAWALLNALPDDAPFDLVAVDRGGDEYRLALTFVRDGYQLTNEVTTEFVRNVAPQQVMSLMASHADAKIAQVLGNA